MNMLHNLESGTFSEMNVVVEIPKGSRNKYEYDFKKEIFKHDRILHSPFHYPIEYGFVPQTWYEDDDPIDGMVMTRYPTFSGCVIECRAIGVFRMKDEHGIDDKLFCIPNDDPYYVKVNDIFDVPEAFLNELQHFFQRYKDLEKGKFSDVVGWFDKKEAEKVFAKAQQMYIDKFGKK